MSWNVPTLSTRKVTLAANKPVQVLFDCPRPRSWSIYGDPSVAVTIYYGGTPGIAAGGPSCAPIFQGAALNRAWRAPLWLVADTDCDAWVAEEVL